MPFLLGLVRFWVPEDGPEAIRDRLDWKNEQALRMLQGGGAAAARLGGLQGLRSSLQFMSSVRPDLISARSRASLCSPPPRVHSESSSSPSPPCTDPEIISQWKKNNTREVGQRREAAFI